MANFLYAAGTNGFIAAPFNLLSTELDALANNATAISSVGGTSGVYSQTNTVSALLASVWLESGGAFTPAAGTTFQGWFLRSSDGGTTFERYVNGTPPPRAPDFVIPLYNSAYAAAGIAWAQGQIVLPAESFKIALINKAGVALPATGNLLKLGALAVKY